MRVFFLLSPLFRQPVTGMRGRQPRGFLIAALITVAMTSAAQADFVTATFDTVAPGEVVSIMTPNGRESGWAGAYDFTNASGLLSGSFQSFCIDISQDIYFGQTVTFGVANLSNAPIPGPEMGQLRAELIAELWHNDYALIGNDNSKAAAFQLAIWEIINQTADANGNLALNVATGTLQATDSDSATITTANNWLGALDLSGNGPKNPTLIALTNPYYQDYVTSVAAPAPSGLVLGGSALAVTALCAGWRRRRQRLGRLAA